jgi:hypothetical protein
MTSCLPLHHRRCRIVELQLSRACRAITKSPIWSACVCGFTAATRAVSHSMPAPATFAGLMETLTMSKRKALPTLTHSQRGDSLLGPNRYRTARPKKSVEQHVPVVWTPCHLGGGRSWFRCTATADGRYCGRRVAKLYLGDSGVFACRQCYGLAYASQLESLQHRGIGKARKIRMRLGGDANILDSFPAKPKRMHWRTYNKLRHLHDLAGARCGIA